MGSAGILERQGMAVSLTSGGTGWKGRILKITALIQDHREGGKPILNPFSADLESRGERNGKTFDGL